ncbi:MAG: amidophosphoribosyltransferase, partial [Cyanobacteria bacterium J149]
MKDNQHNSSVNEHSFLQVDKPEEACGVFGVYAPEETVAKLAYFGLYALQHRGQESAGIATFDNGSCYSYKDMGLVSQVFNESILANLQGQIAVGHTRYSTTGSSLKVNAQPAVVDTRLGKLALAHNGNLVNTLELRQELDRRNGQYVSTTDSEMIAIMIGKEVDTGKDWIEAAISSFKWCQGAYSLVIGTPDGIIGARDPHGIRPLVIGTIRQENNINRYVLASETCALDIIGAEYIRDVEPGELVWIDDNGLTSKKWTEASNPKLCVFEMIYFARPDSIMGHDSLYAYRLRLGEQLAKESLTDADIVMGVPDSGIPAAIGYSRHSGITYQEGLIKNRYVG